MAYWCVNTFLEKAITLDYAAIYRVMSLANASDVRLECSTNASDVRLDVGVLRHVILLTIGGITSVTPWSMTSRLLSLVQLPCPSTVALH